MTVPHRNDQIKTLEDLHLMIRKHREQERF